MHEGVIESEGSLKALLLNLDRDLNLNLALFSSREGKIATKKDKIKIMIKIEIRKV